MKAMTENPQDRSAVAAKLADAFGGKMEAAYWFSSGSDTTTAWLFGYCRTM
jgi:hypothetical protein